MRPTLTGRYVVTKLDEMIAILGGMSDAEANAVPEVGGVQVPGGNTAYQLLEHSLGMLRYWTKDEILREPSGRDRDAEFEARGSVEELVARARRVREELVVDLGRMDPAVTVPPGRGGGRFWASSPEGILLHVLEELCQHLGHLEITRDVVRATSR